MNYRLERIFSEIPPCKVFADIGCDHGYMTKAMVESGKCERAIVSDVSAKCLEKAQTLLSDYIGSGVVESVVSDGFEKVGACDLALIAGMGGEEITAILNACKNLPKKHKNLSKEVRAKKSRNDREIFRSQKRTRHRTAGVLLSFRPPTTSRSVALHALMATLFVIIIAVLS